MMIEKRVALCLLNCLPLPCFITSLMTYVYTLLLFAYAGINAGISIKLIE